jgi:hypothetical protein
MENIKEEFKSFLPAIIIIALALGVLKVLLIM